MPAYRLDQFALEISRKALLLDTNVLVAYSDPGDPDHEPTESFINSTDLQLLVFYAVVVEAWGLLAGAKKKLHDARQMLVWLSQPGSGVDVIPGYFDPFERISHVVTKYDVDCVDALLVQFADRFSRAHNYNPPLRIATYDTTDIYKFLGTGEFRIGTFDPRTRESYP